MREHEATGSNQPRAGADEEWLATTIEEVVDPDLKICDAHHHLWDHPESRYLIEDLHADTGDGHRVVTSVFVECGSEYRTDGPEELRSLGEVEFVAQQAERSRVAAGSEIRGIVSHVDATVGGDVDRILDHHVEVGDGRFRGVRHSAAWDPSPRIKKSHSGAPEGLLRQNNVRIAVDRMGRRGLLFEAWVYWPQLDDVLELAYACPNTVIILDHIGGPIGIGPYAGQRGEILAQIRRRLTEIAESPNVAIKLGGIGMTTFGDEWHRRDVAPTSDELAKEWGPQIRWIIDTFGVERCMFESNFPMDRVSVSYRVLWNAFKKMTSEASEHERALLFHDTATRLYRLDDDF